MMTTDTLSRRAQAFAERASNELDSRTKCAKSDHLVRRRAIECLALTMIGDGTLAFIEPVQHVQLWLRGPSWWRRMLQPFADNPELTRWLGAAEFAFGFWLARKQATDE
jgi:hypothetical protein